MGVSWRRAFRASVAVVLYSLVWFIVGGIIVALGYNSYDSVTICTNGVCHYDNTLTIIMVIAGAGVIWLGVLASFLKVQTDLTADEVEARRWGVSSRSGEYLYTCKNCGNDLVRAGATRDQVTWKCEKCGKLYVVSFEEQNRDGVR